MALCAGPFRPHSAPSLLREDVIYRGPHPERREIPGLVPALLLDWYHRGGLGHREQPAPLDFEQRK